MAGLLVNWKGFGRSSHDLIEVISQNFSRGSKENTRVLGRTNRLLSFDTTRSAYKTKILGGINTDSKVISYASLA
jgi:hypothetical protein